MNTGTTSARVDLNFYADVRGAPLELPLTIPLGSDDTGTVASTLSQSLTGEATLLVQSAAPLSDPTPTIGSAQRTTNGNVGGFVIFRLNPNGQEAVVPLENRNGNVYVIVFDYTGSTATGLPSTTRRHKRRMCRWWSTTMPACRYSGGQRAPGVYTGERQISLDREFAARSGPWRFAFQSRIHLRRCRRC